MVHVIIWVYMKTSNNSSTCKPSFTTSNIFIRVSGSLGGMSNGVYNFKIWVGGTSLMNLIIDNTSTKYTVEKIVI